MKTIVLCWIFLLAGCGSPSPKGCLGQSCSVDSECCDALVCLHGWCQQPIQGGCVSSGGACSASTECCSALVCSGGTCGGTPACRSSGQACAETTDCCASLVCTAGKCATPPSCQAAGKACSASSQCCSPLVCNAAYCTGAVSSAMTWKVKSNYPAAVEYALFDNTLQNRYGWPGGGLIWPIIYGAIDSRGITCTTGHLICIGGRSENAVWGLDEDASRTCTNCCFSCTTRTVSYSFDP